MNKTRRTELADLRKKVLAVRKTAHEERKARVNTFNYRVDSDAWEKANQRHSDACEVWKNACRDFLAEWQRIYGFPYVNSAECCSRIPQEELRYLGGR